MSDTTPTGDTTPLDPTVQPLRDGDTSIEPDPSVDPAQAEWDRTTALDEGASVDDLDAATATGADPAELASPLDEISRDDLPADFRTPESQGEDPVLADLGEDGQGDLAPEDY